MKDSAGIQVAHNDVQGMWGPGDEWTVNEELRIGLVDGAPELQFGRIVSLDVDQAGQIYVLDQQAQEVRVFSPEGEYLRSVGQPGEGPGELSAGAQAAFVAADQTLRVVDPAQGRVTTFGPDGEYVGEFRLDRAAGAAIRWDANASGQLVAQLRVANMGLDDAHRGGDRIVIHDADGALGDTLIVLPSVRNAQVTWFGPEPVWDLGAGVLLTAVTTGYRVETRTWMVR